MNRSIPVALMFLLCRWSAYAAPVVGPASAVAASPAAVTADAGATARQTALTARVIVKVVHPAQVRADLIVAIKKLGGFATLITDDQLRLKVPPEQLSTALQTVTGTGLVIEKSLERVDLTENIAQLQARQRSKQDILKRLRAFFDDSNVQATLQIEGSMNQLVIELEQVKGQLRVEHERARWAVIDVYFQFQQRGKVVYVRSPFEWLNTVDLQRFLGGF